MDGTSCISAEPQAGYWVLGLFLAPLATCDDRRDCMNKVAMLSIAGACRFCVLFVLTQNCDTYMVCCLGLCGSIFECVMMLLFNIPILWKQACMGV